jgi:hypothetical protein
MGRAVSVRTLSSQADFRKFLALFQRFHWRKGLQEIPHFQQAHCLSSPRAAGCEPMRERG